MTTPSRELTPEQIAPALAEAQGWIQSIYAQIKWWHGISGAERGWILPVYEYNPLTDAKQRCKIIEDPEIHAGMGDVLMEWLFDGVLESSEVSDGYYYYWECKGYQQDIRLWQLRACVEFLRRRNING